VATKIEAPIRKTEEDSSTKSRDKCKFVENQSSGSGDTAKKVTTLQKYYALCYYPISTKLTSLVVTVLELPGMKFE
jgi:hypothetical protein